MIINTTSPGSHAFTFEWHGFSAVFYELITHQEQQSTRSVTAPESAKEHLFWCYMLATADVTSHHQPYQMVLQQLSVAALSLPCKTLTCTATHTNQSAARHNSMPYWASRHTPSTPYATAVLSPKCFSELIVCCVLGMHLPLMPNTTTPNPGAVVRCGSLP